MSATVTYEPLVWGDLAEVLALWQRTAGMGLSAADSPSGLQRYLERNPEMSFVARVSGAIVGAVLAGHDGRRGYLQHLAVAEAARGRGIGSQLVNLCLDALRRAGIDKAHVFVLHDNGSGREFWAHQQWQRRDDLVLFSRGTQPADGE